jgi:ribosomal protein L17
MLASVILPRPDSDRKTELNFSVNDSNTAFIRNLCYLPRIRTDIFSAQKSIPQLENCKAVKTLLQGLNPPTMTNNGGYSRIPRLRLDK